jgi:hypothetical protein
MDVGPLTVTTKIVTILYPLTPDCGRTFWVSYAPDTSHGGRVAGSVLMYPDVHVPNRQFKDARISLTQPDAPRSRASLRVDDMGKFEFRNLRPGRYWLLARRRGYWKVRSTVWVMRRDRTVAKVILFKHGHEAVCE